MIGEVKFGMAICNRNIVALLFGWEEFLDRFYGLVCCIVRMMFAVKMVNNKVVGNFFIYLVAKFQDYRPKCLGVISV